MTVLRYAESTQETSVGISGKGRGDMRPKTTLPDKSPLRSTRSGETAPFPPGCPTTEDDTTADLGAGTPPLRFGRYRTLRCLGRGSFGEVFLAYDEELKRFVAVKVQRPDRVFAAFDAGDFVREAQLVARLDHPGIVPVYDVGRAEDGLCYIVSKYINGMTVHQRCRRGRLPVEESVRIVIAVAEALQFAHDDGIIHRDLKPSNILLSTDGQVFLTDFGVALTTADMDTTAALVGTPAYMSPEQARWESHSVDGRSDTFALGTVYYELLVGRHPFKDRDLDDGDLILDRILTENPRPPRQVDPRIPAEYERICLKALAKSAADRYSAPGEMARELRLARDSLRGRGRRGAILLALAIATALVAALWAGLAAGGGRDRRVARWVLASGGSLRTTANPTRVIRSPVGLPSSFRIGYIDLGGNRGIRDEDLGRLLEARYLGSLDLNATSITDRGLDAVGRMQGLAELWLNETGITSEGIRSLEHLRSLVHLDLNGSRITDEGLMTVGKLSRLKFLDLSNTRVTDVGLAPLSALDSLETLRLKNDAITDGGLVHIRGLKSLRNLELGGTGVTAEGLAAFDKARSR